MRCQTKDNNLISYIPDNERVVILSTQGSKVLLVEREGKTLDQNLVQFESVLHLERLEVPDDDIGLKISKKQLVSTEN